MRKQTNIKNLTLYFIRHGKTFFNTTMQVQGCCDSFLTKIGEEQTLLTGQELKNITFEKAYCGDLRRYKQTLQMILKQNQNPVPEITEHYGLREWNFGGFEGRDDEAMWRPVFEKNGLSFDLDFTNFKKLRYHHGKFELLKLAENNYLKK